MRIEVLGGAVDIDDSLVDASPGLIRRRVRAYERGDCGDVELPVTVPATFTGAVMRALTTIPSGETRSYGELAADLETAAIAVGRACGRNPVPLIVPCHRVVGHDGSLRGYSAPGGVALKRRLLDHEARMARTR